MSRHRPRYAAADLHEPGSVRTIGAFLPPNLDDRFRQARWPRKPVRSGILTSRRCTGRVYRHASCRTGGRLQASRTASDPALLWRRGVLGKFLTHAYPVSRSSVKKGFSNRGWRHGWRLPLQVSPSTIFRHAGTLAPIDSHNQGRCGFWLRRSRARADRSTMSRPDWSRRMLPNAASRAASQRSNYSNPRSRSSRRIGSGIAATLAAAALPRSAGAASAFK